EADAEALQRDLTAARNRVEVGALRQEQAQQQAQARQRESERRGAADAARKEQAVREAESALKRAQADYEKTKAGATQADIQTAAAVEKMSQPDPTALAAAQREVVRAQNALRAAQSMKANDGSSRNQRQIAIQNAAVDLQNAQDRLNQVQQGAPPNEVEAAKR